MRLDARVPALATAGGAIGGRRRMKNASAVTTTKQNSPSPKYVWRHPTCST